jgi:hypothetical protein
LKNIWLVENQSLASGTQCEPLSEIKTISENISSGGRGKIRYIAGYCIMLNMTDVII